MNEWLQPGTRPYIYPSWLCAVQVDRPQLVPSARRHCGVFLPALANDARLYFLPALVSAARRCLRRALFATSVTAVLKCDRRSFRANATIAPGSAASLLLGGYFACLDHNFQNGSSPYSHNVHILFECVPVTSLA